MRLSIGRRFYSAHYRFLLIFLIKTLPHLEQCSLPRFACACACKRGLYQAHHLIPLGRNKTSSTQTTVVHAGQAGNVPTLPRAARQPQQSRHLNHRTDPGAAESTNNPHAISGDHTGLAPPRLQFHMPPPKKRRAEPAVLPAVQDSWTLSCVDYAFTRKNLESRRWREG